MIKVITDNIPACTSCQTALHKQHKVQHPNSPTDTDHKNGKKEHNTLPVTYYDFMSQKTALTNINILIHPTECEFLDSDKAVWGLNT